MSERRFTRLKASLSKETAAKTRETVSRELRQSMSTASAVDTALLYCIDGDYERSLREWNEELRGTLTSTLKKNVVSSEEAEGNVPEDEMPPNDLDLLNCFTVPDDDIQVIHETKPNTFDFSRYYPPPDRAKPSSAFAHECILHYTDTRHTIRWASMDRHFGTVFDTCLRGGGGGVSGPENRDPNSTDGRFHHHHLSTSNSTSTFDGYSGRSSTTAERPVFECDLEAASSKGCSNSILLSTQNRLIREGSASVISLEADSGSSSNSERTLKRTGNNTTGWLTLTRDDSNCYLTFYDSVRRDKILWHLEVNRKVSKLVEPPSAVDSEDSDSTDPARLCFRIAKHLIFPDQRYTDDWIKDINVSLGQELDPRAELTRILSGDGPEIARHLKSSDLLAGINLMGAYTADLTGRMGNYPAMKNTIQRVGFRGPSGPGPGLSSAASCFQFQLAIRGFEIASSDRNRITTITSGSVGMANGGGGGVTPPTSGDSFFLRLALFDAKHGKISEEFRFTVSPDIRGLRPSAAAELNRSFDQRLLCTVTRALFTVDLSTSAPADIYLVLRIERTSHRLMHFNCSPSSGSGGNSGSSGTSSSSSNVNNNKTLQQSLISAHVEPYAWSLRPLFQEGALGSWNSASQQVPPLETSPNFGLFFKLDSSRLSDEFICSSLKNLQNHAGEKNSGSHSGHSRNQTAMNGRLEIELQPVSSNSNNFNNSTFCTKHTGHEVITSTPEIITLNPSLFLTSAQPAPTAKQHPPPTPILEIQPLRLLPNPFSEYFHLLYIYPQSLKFDNQRTFSKARNLCITVEVRDSDEMEPFPPQALPVIFGRPHDGGLFVRTASTAVCRHNVNPDFFEEIKIALPLQYSEKLHLLFTLTHLSCKKDLCTYSTVGYAWLPLSPDSTAFRNRPTNPLHSSGQTLSVFASLPNHYLSCQSLGLGKGLSMPDVKFVGKDLLRLSTVLISSVASRDIDLQTTLSSVIKITRSTRDDSRELSQMLSLERSIPKMLRSLPDADGTELVHFSSIILQQLLKLLVFAANQDLIMESFRTVLALVEKFRKEMGQLGLLNVFIEDEFKTAEFCGVWIHEQLIVLCNKVVGELGTFSGSSGSGSNATNLRGASPSSTNGTEDLKLLLHNLWFILRIMIKSMMQYLVATGRATLDREDRFEPEFTTNLKRFCESTTALIATYSRSEEAPPANAALAHFLTRLTSFFDRSVVFNAFYHHVSLLSSRDVVIQELKLSSIATLLAHEHYVAYCNPMIEHDTIDTTSDSSSGCITGNRRSFALSSEYARKHFPVFLLLAEFRNAYTARNTVLTNRPASLYILRNQLAKHLLEEMAPKGGKGRGQAATRALQERVREKVLALYLPALSVILENTNRMVDSTIASKDGKCTFGGSTSVPGTGSGSGGRYWTSASGGDRKSTSPYSTINEMPGLTFDSRGHHHQDSSGSSLQLTRSTSEISQQNNLSITSVSSYSSLTSSAASTLTNCSSTTLTTNYPQHHQRTNSMISTAQLATAVAASASSGGSGRDKFTADEVRDLFVCLLSVVQVLDIDRMNQLQPKSLKDLFLCLECALNAFEYKPAVTSRGSETASSRSKTLPSYLGSFTNHDPPPPSGPSSAPEIYTNYRLTQNLSVQTSLITLRTIHLYLDNDEHPIDTAIIAQILSIYLTLMSLPQAQSVLISVFNSIRYFITKFALLLFNSDGFLSPIIEKVIRYSNSALSPIRTGATDLLYTLLSTNLKRTRFETIVCVSRLASSDIHGLLYLQSSLNRIEALASVDRSDSGIALASGGCVDSSLGTADEEEEEVSILHIVGRIREILKATKQIREESSDPYLASELRLQLANSYARTSRSLLRTWLENLATVHEQNTDWTEAALCRCQVIAILIQQLASKEIDIVEGLSHITKVSENIYTDSIKQESDWLELEECHVGVEVLEKMIREAVDKLEKAGLWELAPHVLKVMCTSYEREYDHKKLAELYTRMARCHSKALEINESGKRLFDTFFRVAFYYPSQYGATKTEYIYKRSKVVSLAEMTGTMQALYPHATFLSADPESLAAFNAAYLAELAADPNNNNNQNSGSSSGSNKSTTPPAVAIVITHVTPYVAGARNAFERSVGVHQFVYEQRLGGKIAQSVAEQYKRRVILTVGNPFPYFLKRIPVADRREVILSPIEVAIDEMQERVHQLEHVIGTRDAKHLQLVLQGSVNATVNAGPIAYANAFLRKPRGGEVDSVDGSIQEELDETLLLDPNSSFSESQKHLKFLFEQFLDLCESALKLNEKLIKPNQIEYHQNLKSHFEKLKDELDFFYERPTSIQIFDVISGSTFA